jgi:hypothetical protein
MGAQVQALPRAMTARQVDAAVERLRVKNPTLGRYAAEAASWLTADEGVGMIDQASLQEFLWWHLPRKTPQSDWDAIAAGAAALLDELGLDRYAVIVRSDTTSQILGAWRFNPDHAAKLVRDAELSSGVRPPDTDLVSWGSIMGIHEHAARQAVARALEAAIVEGELNPGGKGWKIRAAAICDRTMLEPQEDQFGQPLLGLVETERAGTWLDTARVDQHRRWRGEVSRRLMTEIAPPAGVETVVAPMRWLLEQASDGIALTQNNYIARPLVLDAIEAFGWWDWEKPPRSEADVPQLGELRDAAQARRLIRRQGRKLLVTTKGRTIVDDPGALWRELALTLGGSTDFGLMVAELIGLRLLDGTVVGSEGLAHAVGPILAEQGWRAGGEPLGHRDITWAIAQRLYWWRVLGLVDEERPRWVDGDYVGEYSTALNDVGEATVLGFLRARAVRPRDSLRD